MLLGLRPGAPGLMLHVALYQPEIPGNTGNVIRLCANAGATLHLVRPLGFRIDDASLRRAGLDYHEYTTMRVHECWEDLLTSLPEARVLAFSTRAQQRYDAIRYQANDLLLFGPESRGLPADLLDSLPPEQRLRLPMQPQRRSLNLSNTVAIAVYEAWRQLGFAGAG